MAGAKATTEMFELIPEDIPSIKKTSIYESILESFVATGKSPVRVKVTGRTSGTITQGLIKAKSRDKSHYRNVDIVRRGDSVWLKLKGK